MHPICLAASIMMAAMQGAGPRAPIASNPVVGISGRILKVEAGYGQGVPSLEVKTTVGDTVRVWLGSMRYLMEQNFNPKAGQDVKVEGYKLAPGTRPQGCCGMPASPQTSAQKEKLAGEIVAASVTLTQTRQTIQLRDESGMPVWRGRFRGGRGPMRN